MKYYFCKRYHLIYNVCLLYTSTEEEKVEADAKERGFSYVRMDGNIGCMVNGAGLAMATMDMIKTVSYTHLHALLYYIENRKRKGRMPPDPSLHRK